MLADVRRHIHLPLGCCRVPAAADVRGISAAADVGWRVARPGVRAIEASIPTDAFAKSVALGSRSAPFADVISLFYDVLTRKIPRVIDPREYLQSVYLTIFVVGLPHRLPRYSTPHRRRTSC